jgi:hypothetical protein
VYPGSHKTGVTIDHMRATEEAGQATVVESHETANRRYSDDELSRPLVLCAKAGDVVVFDQRIDRRGGRFDDETKSVLTNNQQCQRGADKLTLSSVFGAPNSHSERHQSNFRYARRDLICGPINSDFRSQLVDANLYLNEEDYFLTHLDELDSVWLRKPETRDGLKNEFARSAAEATTESHV